MIRILRTVLTTLSLYFVTHLFIFIFLPILLLISYIDPKRIPGLKQWFVRCLFIIVGKRLKIIGQDNVDPNHRYVIVSNYPSGYAGFALIGQFPQASVVAHAFLERIPLISQALHRIGVIFVRPGPSGQGKRAIDFYLGRGEYIPNLIILPEGGITRDGNIHRFRRGFVHIQRKTSFDILPITLNGLYRLKPFGRIHADPDAIPEMIIHPAIQSESASQMSDKELVEIIQNTISSVYRK